MPCHAGGMCDRAHACSRCSPRLYLSACMPAVRWIIDRVIQPCLHADQALAHVWRRMVVLRPSLSNATSSPWYRVFLAVFAVINIPLACMEIKDQVSVAAKAVAVSEGGLGRGRHGGVRQARLSGRSFVP